MKTYNGLFEKIVDEKNIQKAILRASLGKRKKANVQRTLSRINEVAKNLSEQLKNGTWKPVDLHQSTEINDGVELKKRYIVCPSFAREQCVHHAIMNICEPLFRKKFYQYSCGSVKGHGGDQAKKYVEKITKKYINNLKMDLKPVWQVHKFVSVNFIGYQFKRGGLVRLRDRIFLKSIRLGRRPAAK